MDMTDKTLPTKPPRSLHYQKPCDSDYDHENLYHAMNFFGCLSIIDRLPSIERVGIDGLGEEEYETQGGDENKPWPKPESSNISRIAINRSSISTMCLARILCSCKVNREIQYSVRGRVVSDHSPNFAPKLFMQAILGHKDTLEILDLDVEHEIFLFQEEANEDEIEEVLETEGDDEWGTETFARHLLAEDRMPPISIRNGAGR